MTRKVARTENFDFELSIHRDEFIRPPRPAQRNWLLNQVVREFSDDLHHLNQIARRFVSGADQPPDPPMVDRARGTLDDQQIMEDWQLPLMTAMAATVSASGGDVLEVGFGRGVSAAEIQRAGVRSHTIIEANPAIANRFEGWRADYRDRDIRLLVGRWQDVLESAGLFDAIFFHTYPLTEEEAIAYLSQSVTFAEHFFPHAARHLRPNGVFTYLSNEVDSLSRAHQRRLLQHFSAFSVSVVPLTLPHDVRDAWWADSMVVVAARAAG